jgi:hypothetical protein
MDFLVGGRYIDRFQKRDGVWKISQRGTEDLVFRAREAYQQE